MEQRTRVGIAVVATVCLFLTVQLGALALAPEFDQRGGSSVTENPDDPSNSISYVGVVLVATAVMLVLIKLGAEQVIRAIVLLTSGFLSYYVLAVVLFKGLGGLVAPSLLFWGALGGAGLVFLGLLFYPEWYVIDAAGVLMGAGAAGLFGINFGVLPAILLLVVLAVYDAISVYGTEHMLTLAEGVMDLKIPILLVVPTSLSFSMDDLAEQPEDPEHEPVAGCEGEPASGADPGTTIPDGSTGAVADQPEEAAVDDPVAEDAAAPDGDAPGDPPTGEADSDPLVRDALFIGLGDAVIPTVLVASGGFFLQRRAGTLVEGLALNLPALGGIVGTTVGLLALLYLVLEGRPHAGLPLLNGGAIAGYLLGALAAGVPLAVALGL
jgi:presenilin-like A22 family membrane protease